MYHKITQYTMLSVDKESASPFLHFSLLNFIHDIEETLDNGEFDEIVNDKGADGPIAAEIYRMLVILNNNLVELYQIEKNIKKLRAKENRMPYLSHPVRREIYPKNN